MEPVYGFMPSYPYPRDQMQYGPNYYPGSESAPPNMFMNHARPHGSCEHRPWRNSYGYHPYPVQCHGCCDHGYLPSQYAWSPPYPHVPLVQYPGNYHPFSSQYVPPPHYAFERPWAGYDRDMPRDHHCCGCPNHSHSPKEQKSVKIVEEEPERERKMDNHESPFRFKNSPFPLVWLPPDYSKDNEHQASDISEQNQKKDGSFQQPGLWNGWRPIQMSKIGLPTEDGNKNVNNPQSRDGKEYLPFPMFWMPYLPAEKESEKPKEKNTNPVLRLESVKDSGKHMGDHAAPLAKDIQVKSAEEHEENVTSGRKEKGRDTSLKVGSENEEKGPKDDPNRKPSSPRKSSKLPPVCLRVDPLPRRKTANGSSRSPSPPRDKQKREQPSSELSKVPGSSGGEKSNTREELKANERITKTIQVVDGRSGQGENIQVSRTDPVNHGFQCQGDVLKKATEVQNRMEECIKPDEAVIKAQSEDGDNRKVYLAKEIIAEGQEEPRKASKAKLSEEEAAVIIQSVFRGFDVRRWEPVKKLKQIAKVRERIAEVKDLIRAMELSTDIQAKRKQQTIIAETIMSLLLDLDTIQGLHPSIREVRKAVVRKLVSLQEELDSVTYEITEASTGQETTTRHDEEASQNSNEMSDLAEPCPKQLDGGSHDGNAGILEADLIGKKVNTEKEKGSTEVLESHTVKDSKLPPKAAVDDQSKQTSEMDEVFIANEAEEQMDPAPRESYKVLFSQNTSPVEVTDFAPDNEEKLQNELLELPQDVSGDFSAPEGTEDGKWDAEINEANLGTDTQEEEFVNMCSSELEKGENDEGKRGNMDKLLDNPVDESHESSQQEQLDEVIALEPQNSTRCEGEHESMDIPVDGVDVRLETKETPQEASESVEQVDKRTTGDLSFESGFGSQLPASVPAEIFGSSEASAEKEHPVETCNIKGEPCHEANGHHDTVDAKSSSASGETPITSSEKHPSLELEAIPLKKPVDPDEEGAVTRVTEEAEHQVKVDQIAKERQGTKHFENASSQDMSCEACQGEKERSSLSSESPEHLSSEKNLEKPNAADDASPGVNNESISNVMCPPSRDELGVSNGKLVEENEKLRDMVDKLIKSGEEQMNVISRLSGRLKDLERNLSRKKKLKMKRFSARRSS